MTQPTDSPHQLLLAGVKAHQSGNLRGAEEIYRTILEMDPGLADAWHLLGVLAQQTGKPELGLSLIERGLALAPDSAPFHMSRGQALKALGRPQEAATSYNDALRLEPGLFEAHYNLGNLLLETGRHAEAARHYQEALAVRPDAASASLNLAVAQRALGGLDSALENAAAALALTPADARAHAVIAGIHLDAGRPGKAATHFEKALEIDPDHVNALTGLGAALHAEGHKERGLEHLRRAVANDPEHAMARFNLACALHEDNEYEAAAREYRKTLEIDPGMHQAANNLGTVLAASGNPGEAASAYRQAMEGGGPRAAAYHSNLILTLNYLPETTPADLLREARDWDARHGTGVLPLPEPHPNQPDPDRPLRLGYLSGDFRGHPVGHFIRPILAGLRRDSFTVLAFTTGSEDSWTPGHRQAVDEWYDISSMDDDAAATLIREQQVDVLIDLSGHTAGNRLPVLARKPAPVQAVWLGWFATTGCPAMDWLIGDHTTLNLSEDESYYTEQLWPLQDHCFFPYSPSADVAHSEDIPCNKNSYVTFGCFNNPAKLRGPVLAAWGRILAASGDARLLLKSGAYDSPAVREQMLERLGAAGVNPTLVLFEGATDLEGYFQAHDRVDVALDPFPYNGGTMTMDALWMGVPVVALRGTTFAGRMAASILAAASLDHLVAGDVDEYVAKAQALAQAPEKLAVFRRRLRGRVQESPLGDTVGFTRELEAACCAMWRRWCETR